MCRLKYYIFSKKIFTLYQDPDVLGPRPLLSLPAGRQVKLMQLMLYFIAGLYSLSPVDV